MELKLAKVKMQVELQRLQNKKLALDAQQARTHQTVGMIL